MFAAARWGARLVEDRVRPLRHHLVGGDARGLGQHRISAVLLQHLRIEDEDAG